VGLTMATWRDPRTPIHVGRPQWIAGRFWLRAKGPAWASLSGAVYGEESYLQGV